MKNRTRRRRKRKGINLNRILIVGLLLSIITVFGVFSVPKILLNKFQSVYNSKEQQITVTESVTKSHVENNINYANTIANSSISFSKYDDITSVENKAKELLSKASNDGLIYSEDYSSKNVTTSYGNIKIRNTTKSYTVDIKEYLKKDITAKVNAKQPVVLVYHTHASEGYQILDNSFYSNSLIADSNTLGVIRVGEALCQKIRASGYEVIHDTSIYDSSFSGAFERSRENVSKILKENPSIQIVIDLHRDSVSKKDGSKIKTVTEIDGRKVAQIQITAGCEDGAVTNFPNWNKNLTFAVHLQNALTQKCENIARPIFFCARKYNMDLVPCALNIDIGTESNTVREATYSAEILGSAIVNVLKECEENDRNI